MTCPAWCANHFLGDHRSAELPLPPDAPIHVTAWIDAPYEEPGNATVRLDSDGGQDVRLDADATDRFADTLEEYATRLRWLATLMRDPDTAGAPVLLKLLARGEDAWWHEIDASHDAARARAAAQPPAWRPNGQPRLTVVR